MKDMIPSRHKKTGHAISWRPSFLPLVLLILLSLIAPCVACASGTAPKDGRYGIHFAPLKFYWQGDGYARFFPEITKAIKTAGCNNVRISVTWGMLEPSEGVYDWHLLDDLLARFPEDSFDYTIRLYTSSDWAVPRSSGQLWLPGIPRAGLPRDLKKYERFLEVLIQRYKGRIRYWQIDNEIFSHEHTWSGTPDDYLRILRSAYTIIKSEDPAAKVILAGIALGIQDLGSLTAALKKNEKVKKSYAFLTTVLDQGRDYYDILDLHLYWKAEEIPERIRFLKKQVNKLGYDKPIFILETGGPDIRAYLTQQEFNAVKKIGDSPKIRNSAQRLHNPEALNIILPERRVELAKIVAQEVIKRYVLCFSEGVGSVHWLRSYSIESGGDIWWDKMGLANAKSPEADYGLQAYALLTRMLGDFTDITHVGRQEQGYLFKVTRGDGRTLYVGWSETPRDITIPWNGDGVEVVDAYGTKSRLQPEHGKITIPLNPVPVFISSNSL